MIGECGVSDERPSVLERGDAVANDLRGFGRNGERIMARTLLSLSVVRAGSGTRAR